MTDKENQDDQKRNASKSSLSSSDPGVTSPSQGLIIIKTIYYYSRKEREMLLLSDLSRSLPLCVSVE